MKGIKLPLRFWIGVMIFFTTFTNYMTRSSLSVSVVSMVKPIAKHFKGDCEPVHKSSSGDLEDFGTRFEWDELSQSYVIGSYFWGYIAFCLPSGIIAEWMGPWNTIFHSTWVASLFTSLIHPAAFWGWPYVVSCRIIIGATGALQYPAINVLIAKWAPPDEKGKFMFAMMGNSIGTVVTWPLVGQTTSTFGWLWGIHIVSILGMIYLVVFGFVVSDSPENHRWISEKERDYIREKQAGTISQKKSIPPYWKIFTSIRFWAMTVAQFGNLWSLNLILTGVPKYLSEAIGFDLKSSAVVASIPYLIRFIMSFIMGAAGDFVRKKQWMSVTAIRKTFCISSHFLTGLMLTMISLAGCNYIAIIALLTLSQGFNSALVHSHFQNPHDLAPNYAGTLYSLFSFFGGVTGFIVPIVTAAFTKKENTVGNWAYIFLIGGCVIMACGAFFIAFATGEVQSWNKTKEQREAEAAAAAAS